MIMRVCLKSKTEVSQRKKKFLLSTPASALA